MEKRVTQVERRTPGEVTLRRLHPELEADRDLAAQLDRGSLDAINPAASEDDAASAHEPMTPEELTAWMTDSDMNMLRVIEVTGHTQDASKVVGLVNFYQDTGAPNFDRRAAESRKRAGVLSSTPVWEFNFYMFPDEGEEEVNDSIVRGGVSKGIQEFSELHKGESLLLMFADDEDITDTAKGLMKEKELSLKLSAGKKRLSPIDMLAQLAMGSEGRSQVEKGFQDTRILKQLGFDSLGDMLYSAREKLPNWVYAKILNPLFSTG